MVGEYALNPNRFYEIAADSYSPRAISQIVDYQRVLEPIESDLFGNLQLEIPLLKKFIFHNHGLEMIRLSYEDIDQTLLRNGLNGNRHARNSLQCHKFVFGEDFKFDIESTVRAHSLLMEGVIDECTDTIPEMGIRREPIFYCNSGEMFELMNPLLIEEKLEELYQWLGNTELRKNAEVNPKEVVKNIYRGINFYFNFERIHPFNDGNGRIGRILLLRLMSQTGYYPFYFSADRRNKHLNTFSRATRTGNRKVFSDFFIKEYRTCLEERIAEQEEEKKLTPYPFTPL